MNKPLQELGQQIASLYEQIGWTQFEDNHLAYRDGSDHEGVPFVNYEPAYHCATSTRQAGWYGGWADDPLPDNSPLLGVSIYPYQTLNHPAVSIQQIDARMSLHTDAGKACLIDPSLVPCKDDAIAEGIENHVEFYRCNCSTAPADAPRPDGVDGANTGTP